MQVFVKNRDSISAPAIFFTPPVNVSGMSLITLALIAHDVNGTTPSLVVTPQTSDNLEDWLSLSTTVGVTMADYQVDKLTASADNYGQYIRFKIVVTGTNPFFNYSLIMNTFMSS